MYPFQACWESIREALSSDGDEVALWHELGPDAARYVTSRHVTSRHVTSRHFSIIKNV